VVLTQPEGDYQYGFRVPLIVVSAYTPAGTLNNVRHDFGSILRFIEFNFGISQGALNFADARASTDLTEFFDLTKPPRVFQTIPARKTANFFLHDRRKATDPEDQ
jgi:phospholipase C